jgi:hypothetical protein
MASKKKSTKKSASKRKTSTRKTSTRKATKRKTSTRKATKRKTSTRKATKRKATGRKYGAAATKKVGRAMHEMKRGKLKSGRSGQKVKSRKQAIAIGLSQARKRGAKVPKKR